MTTYKNLEIFIQVTLAICGGLAYLAVNKIAGNKELVVYMVKVAAGFQLLPGVYTSVAITMHMLSAIRRYPDKNNLLKKAIGWLEPYMILFVLAVSSLVACTAYFRMAVAITAGS